LVEKNKANLEKFCLKQGSFSRNRKLNLTHTIGHVLYLAASRNQNGYEISSLNYFSEWNQQTRESFQSASRSSICEARQKLSFKAFEFLLKAANLKQDSIPKKQLWNGHVVRAADGTKITLPASREILNSFPRRLNRSYPEHYPFGILMTAVNVFTGQPNSARLVNKNGSERDELLSMLREFEDGDILLLDRGLDGGRVWEKIEEHGQFYISRVRSSGGGSFLKAKQLIASGRSEITITHRWRTRDKKGELKIRLIRGRKLKDGTYLVLATNLLDKSQYPCKQILALYSKRWKVETHYYRTKTLLNLSNFHARTENGIKQELFANLLILSLTSLAVLDARELVIDENSSPNFKNATEVVRRHLFHVIGTPQTRSQSIRHASRMIEEIARVVCRSQPGRSSPRYSRQPMNRWCFAKANKIQRFNTSGKSGY
jgi:hypothetical protein